MRRSATLVLIAAAVFAVAGLVVAADAPDVIKMESPLWEKHTQPIVAFSHKKHSTDYKLACTECHHEYQDGKNVWKEGDPVKKCEECHNIATNPKSDKEGYRKLSRDEKKLTLYWAIHENCKDCHTKLKRKDRAKYRDIPTSCFKCHPKKK